MAEGYEQFYRTWCYSGRSVSGADGWKIRAKSEKLALPEAEGLADLANYWSPTEFSREFVPGRRLALFRRTEDCVLANGVPVPGLVGGRGGVSFEHVVVGLPKGFSAFDAVKLWRASFWQTQDGDFAPQLTQLACDGASAWTGFQPAQSVPGEGDSAVIMELLNRSEIVSWSSFMLRACLAAATGAVDKVFVAGTDDSIARLLFVALYCLPERFRRQLTFSTHENPKATKGVQIVGVTTFEGGETDFPRFCYDGRYCAINTLNGNKSENLATSIFADSAIQWLLAGQFGFLENVRRGFDALDPLDNPGIGELELLTQNPPLGDGAPLESEGCLNLLRSPAIGRAMLRDRAELVAIMNLAHSDEGFKNSVVGQLSTWLPKHATASNEFPSALAGIALEQIQAGNVFEEVAGLADFCRGVEGNLELPFWERLLMLCQAWVNQGDGSNANLLGIDTRIRLIEVWHHWHQVPEQFAGDPFGEVFSAWLQVAPLDLWVVLNSSLKDNLKQLTLNLWLNVKNTGEFQAVIKQSRDDQTCRDQLVRQLAGLFKVRPDVFRGFPASLAVLGLEELRMENDFSKVTCLADLAREVSPMMEIRFWEELLVACEAGITRPETGQTLLPELNTRIGVIERWERHTKGKEGVLKGVIAGAWLRVGPQELPPVLSSGLSAELKLESFRLCLTGTLPIDQPTGEQIIGLVSKNLKLTRGVFFGIPQWQRGAAIVRVPEICWTKLLESQTEKLSLTDLLDDGLVETVAFWVNKVPNAVPSPMRALFSFGQFFKSPGAFQTVGNLAPELLSPDFWTRRTDRTAAAAGAVDKLLNRGDLADFERALEWFGDRKLTNSPVDFLELAYTRMQSNAVKCRDASLQRLLEVLGLVLKEWKNPSSRKEKGATSEPVVNKLAAEEYAALGRIGMRYLPGSSLLKSPTGQQVVQLLQTQSHILGPMQNAWAEQLQSLLEVQELINSNTELAPEKKGELIRTLAEAYSAMSRPEDQEVRDWIHRLLLEWSQQQPKLVLAILTKFTHSVYKSQKHLFLNSFISPFRQGLTTLERKRRDGLIASEFVRWYFNDGEKLFENDSELVKGWLTDFLRELSDESRTKTDKDLRLVVKCSEDTIKRWREMSGYQERWWQTRAAKLILAFALVVMLLAAVLFGIIGYKIYPWLKHITHGDKEGNPPTATNTSTVNPQKSNPGK
ncbi:MAG: hypothetical protein WBN22_05935 [Verrucomicrobiia bacterium]